MARDMSVSPAMRARVEPSPWKRALWPDGRRCVSRRSCPSPWSAQVWHFARLAPAPPELSPSFGRLLEVPVTAALRLTASLGGRLCRIHLMVRVPPEDKEEFVARETPYAAATTDTKSEEFIET